MAKFLDNWKNKVTTYKNKAEEIRAMIEEGAETIRDIRADVEGTVEDLKADSEEKMMESLEKIQDSERVFKEAGYLLSAIELEMGFNPKVVAVLKRESEIGSRKKERLLKQHEDNKLLSTVLTSLFKAEALEDKVHLRRLTFSEVHIEMGLVPAVHVLWEDKAASGISTDAILPIEESPSSSGSSFTSNSSFTSSRSSFVSQPSTFTSGETAEAAPTEEETPPLPPAEPTAEEAAAPPPPQTETEEEEDAESFTAPVVSASARDPEDDKWTSFPDISFPSSKDDK